MKEVILNDECAHCTCRECHDGEHFCNQAMKENSFYKNKKLYKGLKVIHRPTYEELEKDKQYFSDSLDKQIEATLKLQQENEELKELLDCKNCCELEESECESCAEFGHFRCKGKAQLIKAIELIEDMYNRIPASHSDYYKDVMGRARELLREVDK